MRVYDEPKKKFSNHVVSSNVCYFCWYLDRAVMKIHRSPLILNNVSTETHRYIFRSKRLCRSFSQGAVVCNIASTKYFQIIFPDFVRGDAENHSV